MDRRDRLQGGDALVLGLAGAALFFFTLLQR